MKLVLTADAWQKMRYYVDACTGEVSGLGRIEKRDGDLYVTDVAIFEQAVSGSHSDIDTDALARFQVERVRAGDDMSGWRLWWHSHASMKAFFSGTDTSTIDASHEFGYLVSLVTNHEHDIVARVDVYEPVRVHATLEVEIEERENDELKKAVEAEVREKVRRATSVTKSDKREPVGYRYTLGDDYLYRYYARDDYEEATKKQATLPRIVDIEEADEGEALNEYYEEKEALVEELQEARKLGDDASVQIAETMLCELKQKGKALGIEN